MNEHNCNLNLPKSWLSDSANISCLNEKQMKNISTMSCSPLGTAVLEGHYLTTKAFLSLAEKYSYYTGFNINNYFEIEQVGYSLLHLAVVGMVYCEHGFLDSQVFHQAYACLNKPANTNICKYEHLKIIQLLFDHGIDVNIKDIYKGITSFHILFTNMPENKLCSAFSPFIKQANINLNTQTNCGATVLHNCLSSRKKQMLSVKLLLDHGADMFIPDNNGIMAVDNIDPMSPVQEQLFANAIRIRNNNKKNINRLLTHNTSDICDICGKISKIDIDRNFNCIGCNSRTYCSLKCQKHDWIENNHKKQCLNKRKELKETKILENSGKNKFDLCFYVQSKIMKKESFYGEDFPCVVRENIDWKITMCDRECAMTAIPHHCVESQLQTKNFDEQTCARHVPMEELLKKRQRLGKLHSKYIGKARKRTQNCKHVANIYGGKGKTGKLAQILLKAPNGNGIEKKFIIKIQISSSYFEEEIKMTNKCVYNINVPKRPDLDVDMESLFDDPHMLEEIREQIAENLNLPPDLVLQMEQRKKFSYATEHSKQGNVILVYNRDRSYVAFITRNNSAIERKKAPQHAQADNKQCVIGTGRRKRKRKRKKGRGRNNWNVMHHRKKVQLQTCQRKNFDIIANIIKEKGWKTYKMYCYGYIDKKNENVLHILANDILAHQRW